MTTRISDEDRKHLEKALAAALLLLYLEYRNLALDQLGQDESQDASDEAKAAILAFAADRAGKAQRGVNARLEAAGDDPQAIADAKAEMDQYNHDFLIPWMTLSMSNMAVRDAYDETPGNKPGTTATDDQEWEWTQYTDYSDSCTLAAQASPAKRDELVAIAGGEPAVHDHCQCTLLPVTG